MAYRVGADWQSRKLSEGKPMGLVRADFVLINRFMNKTVNIKAKASHRILDSGVGRVLVDDGAVHSERYLRHEFDSE